ncbi:MAG TPA: hypothetical protein VF057_06420 [Thermoanaerobaculia bacterium]
MQPLVGEERREFQRLRVDPPTPARLGSHDVTILEIGVLGARVQHEERIEDQYLELQFEVRDAPTTLKCEVVRHSGTPPHIESGIRFLAAVGDSGDRLRGYLAQLVAREFEVRRNVPKNSIPSESSVDGDRTIRGKDARFLCYRLENGHWRKTRAFLPEQPSSGFTVAQWVEPAEITRLCQVFEAADAEGRRLIQLFAELSVSGELEIPPRV